MDIFCTFPCRSIFNMFPSRPFPSGMSRGTLNISRVPNWFTYIHYTSTSSLLGIPFPQTPLHEQTDWCDDLSTGPGPFLWIATFPRVPRTPNSGRTKIPGRRDFAENNNGNLRGTSPNAILLLEIRRLLIHETFWNEMMVVQNPSKKRHAETRPRGGIQGVPLRIPMKQLPGHPGFLGWGRGEKKKRRRFLKR